MAYVHDTGFVVCQVLMHAQALHIVPAAVGCSSACSVQRVCLVIAISCGSCSFVRVACADSMLYWAESVPNKLPACALPCFKTLSWLLLSMQPSHELQNVDEVLTLVSKHPHGVMAGQIKDAYRGVIEDVKV